jgi:hypothetical protein
MRKWQSHKVVEAEVIERVEIDGTDHRISTGRIRVEGGETIEAPRGFFARNKPMPGDYLVRYADGYLSWSPKSAFEDGYTEVKTVEFT